MKNCQEPGSRVWYSDSENPKRTYTCTWELVEVDGKHIVGINTGLANKLVHEAITSNSIEELTAYGSLRTEVAMESRRAASTYFSREPLGTRMHCVMSK